MTLAVGIGVNAGVFSFVNAFRTIPQRFHEPDQLVSLRSIGPDHKRALVGGGDYLDWREQSNSFSEMGLYYPGSVTMTGHGISEVVGSVHCTATLLSMFRMGTQLGRCPTMKEDSPSGNRVVLLTDGFWRRKFDAAPDVIGKTIEINDQAHVIIGVMASKFDNAFLWYQAGLVVPLRLDPAAPRRGVGGYNAVARLKRGVTFNQAQTEMDVISARLGDTYAQTNEDWSGTFDSTRIGNRIHVVERKRY